MTKFELSVDVAKLSEFSKEIRRELHKIPEASGVEFKTSSFLIEKMAELGYETTTYPDCTGFIADLKVSDEFKTIGWRADIDGLEMEDKTCDAYTSTHEGMAHNCGHDTHMAIAVTAAKYLIEHKEELEHNVRFIFQMAEEDMRVPGANRMVELGALDGVDEVYALHNDGALPHGFVKINDGIMSSFGHAWTLDVRGVSAHGSTPHLGLDAIRETSRLIEHMDYIVAKKTSPFNPAVFGCGMINGGLIPNAVCDHVQARGTIRSMDAETDEVLRNSFHEVVAVSKAAGFDTTISCSGYPAVINHKDAWQRVLNAAICVVGEDYIDDKCNPMTGSEDFSFMVNAVPEKKGAMFFLGMGNPDKGIVNYLHSNPYYVEEDGMIVGVQIIVNMLTFK